MEQKHYLYHYVSEGMQGNILYPLNVLKEKYPNAYAKQVKKYTGRAALMQVTIPYLDCLWNDVIHFSAINPKEMKQALVDAGMPAAYALSFYQIDPASLKAEYAIVYLYPDDRGALHMQENDFVQYDPEEIEKYSHLPEVTRQFYRDSYAQGKLPHINHRVPHIFYKGSLDITGLPIVTV